ncbi:MAG: alanine/ornithine racemase family PLP-dependent enzyme [Candidatus Wallbacteria bacterium]|nr:alanine/ornithine racemase family PLP-dependent enzyme [Candidatus Wallbacteria bacterium]
MSSFLEIHLPRIEKNASSIVKLCHKNQVSCFGVTKVFCAEENIVRAMIKGGVDGLADSRIENIAKLRKMKTGLPLMLLRIVSPSEASEVVELCDYSLNSEISTLKKLDAAAKKQKKRHKVVAMIDIGDLREGMMADEVMNFFAQAVKLKNIRIAGIGTNTACFGGVIPTTENMNQILAIKALLEMQFGLSLDMVSGGNSSGLPLLASGKMPKGINHFRVGEAMVLGRNVIDRSPFPGTRQDTFIFKGEIVEYRVKPSVPIGNRGQNAFGETDEFPQRGEIRRAIIAAGRQDLKLDGLTPVDPETKILGGSSDHLIVEVKGDPSRYKVGGFMPFYPNYGCLLALATSPYIRKKVIGDG